MSPLTMRHLGLATLLLALQSSSAPAKSGKLRVERTDSESLKEAIVAAGVITASHPELTYDSQMLDSLWKIVSLVRLLAKATDINAMDALASLNSYRLGAAGSEDLRCLQSQFGRPYRAKLDRLRSSGASDCRSAFPKLADRLCRTPGELEGALSEAIAAIDSGRKCVVEP